MSPNFFTNPVARKHAARQLGIIYWMLLLTAGFALGQSKPARHAEDKKNPPPQVVVQEPPEEDAITAEKEYSFNPLEAAKNVRIGGYYFKKRSYRAAARRFEEALKWNPQFPEAYLRLAEAREKLKDEDGARDAYKKFLELEPDGKDSAAVRKKLGSRL